MRHGASCGSAQDSPVGSEFPSSRLRTRKARTRERHPPGAHDCGRRPAGSGALAEHRLADNTYCNRTLGSREVALRPHAAGIRNEVIESWGQPGSTAKRAIAHSGSRGSATRCMRVVSAGNPFGADGGPHSGIMCSPAVVARRHERQERHGRDRPLLHKMIRQSSKSGD